MSDSKKVSQLKRLERMVSYSKALGNYCQEYYEEDPYDPHGNCPFWNEEVCVLQESHPSDWNTFRIVLNNVVQEQEDS